MKTLAIISEYNPFHLGHKYHIERSKLKTNCDAVIALMSGSFVQRGEPAIMDKFRRSRSAIDSGVDLVLELPFIYASQRAESFSEGAIKILNALKLVDYISFGAETSDLKLLKNIAKTLVEEPSSYKEDLNIYIKENTPFAIARAKALSNYLKNPNIDLILSRSNNILAVEYLKQLQITKSTIEPILINRIGEEHNSSNISGISSATGIRNLIYKKGASEVENLVTSSSFKWLLDFEKNYGFPNIESRYEDILLYVLRNEFFPNNIVDSTDDLINRLVNNSRKYDNLNDVISKTISKNYTRSRVKRLLIHILHKFTEEKFLSINKEPIDCIRVLGSSEVGLSLLAQIKNQTSLQVINKFSNINKVQNPTSKELISLDKLSTDMFFSSIKSRKYNMDFYISPYIKKA